MSTSLPYTMKDTQYDNAKFRRRSCLKVINLVSLSNKMKKNCMRCSTGKFLVLLMICGLVYLMLTNTSHVKYVSYKVRSGVGTMAKENLTIAGSTKIKKLLRRAPRLVPRLWASENGRKDHNKWLVRQQSVKEAFIHAWSGYKNYAMGHDELLPMSKRGVDGLGGLGATIVDSLDTALIMGADEVVLQAGSWIETYLSDRISQKGQVNLFETTIRVLGGLLSAYHLCEVKQGMGTLHDGPQPYVYLELAKKLADRLLYAFYSSPSSIPFSDVILRESSARVAADGLSSTSEVSTLQLEFNYLSSVCGDPKYTIEAMKVLEHIRTLPKVEGLVPIFVSPYSGKFSGENIRLGSRGDSYYEYLLKVWLQQGTGTDSNMTYLYDMYKEAMKGVRHLLVRNSVPNGLVFVGELPFGSNGAFSPKMDHLVCFLPGTLALGATKGITRDKAMRDNLLTFEDLENLKLAEDLAKTCFEMYSVTSTGLAPEIAYFHIEEFFEDGLHGGNKSSKYVNDIIIKAHDRHNLLRPETVESLFVLYRITENQKYRDWGWQIFEAFEKYTKVDSGGYSSLDDVTMLPPRKRDKMETFFLGETLKYLYLLFGEKTVLPLESFVFNTEAHPFPIEGTTQKGVMHSTH